MPWPELSVRTGTWIPTGSQSALGIVAQYISWYPKPLVEEGDFRFLVRWRWMSPT